MVEFLMIVLASMVLAAGIGVARNFHTNDLTLGWAGWSRSRVKRLIVSRKLRLAAGELALIMGDKTWRPSETQERTCFYRIPSSGRPWSSALKAEIRGTKGSQRSRKSSLAFLLAKRARDVARKTERQARKVEKSTNRAMPKGVWLNKLKDEQASSVTTFQPARRKWAETVKATKEMGQLIQLARRSSVSGYHIAADNLENALAQRQSARSYFAMAQARTSVLWATADLKEELLAA